MAEEETTAVVEEETGGEEHGYRIPMNLRVDKEEDASKAAAPADSKEGIAEEGPEDEGAAEAEEVDVTAESLPKLETIDLDAIIDQEELGIDKGLSEDEKRAAIAKALGFEAKAEPTVPEKIEDVEQLQAQVEDLQRQIGMLTPAGDLMMSLENDPQTGLRMLAQHYGVDLGGMAVPGAGPDAALQDFEFKMPHVEPGANEDMPTYMGRLVGEGLKAVLPDLVQRIRAAGDPPAELGAGAPKVDTRVVNAMKYLDKYHPEWPQHQEKILDLLKVNPTLVSDPETLYQRASGRKTARGAAKAKKVKLKRVGATGERGGRKPIGVVPKKVLDPSRASDFGEAWNRAKRATEKRG
jgi:hypothetical protein